jgi:uncharacterized protein YceK
MRASLLLTISGLAMLGFLTGCGTIIARTDTSDQLGDFYKATKVDVFVMRTGGDVYAGGHGSVPLSGTLVLVPFHVIDIPISLVTDTLCLPNDTVKHYRNEELKSRTFEMQIGVANRNMPEMILVDTSYRHPPSTDVSLGYTNWWGMFRCIRSGETNKVTLFESFGCPGTVNHYKLNNVSRDSVYIEKQKPTAK